MSQNSVSSYSTILDQAQAGQKFDLGTDYVESFAAQGAIGFGVACVSGTDPDKQVKKAAADTEVFRGISVFTHTRELPRDGEAGYADKDTVSVMREGRIWVRVSDDVEVGDDAYVDLNSTDDAKFTNQVTGNLGPVGKFTRSGSADGLAVLDVRA